MTSEPKDPPQDPISELISAANANTAEARARFGGLTWEQLNWKPSADAWSVAQCLDHLVTTHASYFPTFEKAFDGEQKSTIWERLPWLPGLWGRLLLQAVSPESPRKHKAPRIFQPEASGIDEEIVRRFLEQQEQLIR
jgi:DinB superfamily